jgi:hypothetical protein
MATGFRLLLAATEHADRGTVRVAGLTAALTRRLFHKAWPLVVHSAEAIPIGHSGFRRRESAGEGAAYHSALNQLGAPRRTL